VTVEDFRTQPERSVRLTTVGEEVERAQARLRRDATPIDGSSVLGAGPHRLPYVWTPAGRGEAARELVRFQARHGECDLDTLWSCSLPGRRSEPAGVLRVAMRLRAGEQAVARAFYFDLVPDRYEGRIRFLGLLSHVLETGRLALYPREPADPAREEPVLFALYPNNHEVIRAVLDRYDALGLAGVGR
jgi:hypothetical protein